MNKKIIELTDREKFIAHYVSSVIVGCMTRQSNHAIDKTISKLKKARARHLADEEISSVIGLLDEEFIISGSWLSSINRDLRNSEDLR